METIKILLKLPVLELSHWISWSIVARATNMLFENVDDSQNDNGSSVIIARVKNKNNNNNNE